MRMIDIKFSTPKSDFAEGLIMSDIRNLNRKEPGWLKHVIVTEFVLNALRGDCYMYATL